MRKVHRHYVHEECTESCPAYDPKAWRCQGCGRQVPMLAETENLPVPLCADCFEAAP